MKTQANEEGTPPDGGEQAGRHLHVEVGGHYVYTQNNISDQSEPSLDVHDHV